MENIDKEIRKSLLICVPYLVIIFFLDDLDKFFYTIHSRLGNPLLVVYMFASTVVILSLLMHLVVAIKENYGSYGYKAMLPLLVCLIALVNSFWSPVRVSSEVFKNKLSYRAYRTDPGGHAQMKMRDNGNLEVRYPGPFGMADWEYGQWISRGDTFYLKYEKGMDTIAPKPDTLIKSSVGLLTPIGIPDDTLKIYKDRFFILARARKKK